MYVRRTQRGFTLVEVLVSVALVALLAAILYPVFAASRERARQSVCLSNLRRLGQALTMYHQDCGSYPPFPAWLDPLMPYVKDRRVLLCPSFKAPEGIQVASSYRYPLDGDRLRYSGSDLNSRTVILYCASHTKLERTEPPGPENPTGSTIYGGTYVILRHDGSVERLSADKVKVAGATVSLPGARVLTQVEVPLFPE
jgi:prepilin-type N-terminal cleavage/methylation domain-containing protein